MKKFILYFCFLFSLDVNSQSFKISVEDKTFENKIKTSIYLIYMTNSTDFIRLSAECSRITVSSDSLFHNSDSSVIRIPLKLVSQPSYNELASWLVYYSCYLTSKNRYSRKDLVDSISLKCENQFRTLLLNQNRIPETKSSMRKLRKESKNYWENNPYHNIPIPQIPDTTMSSETISLSKNDEKETFLQKIIRFFLDIF